MKVAIPMNDDRKTICASFGRTTEFLIVDTEKGKREFLYNQAVSASGGAGIQAAQLIVDKGVQALLTPRCGESAAKVLGAANIKIYQTISQDIEDNFTSFTQDKLEILSEIHAGFHNHGRDK